MSVKLITRKQTMAATLVEVTATAMTKWDPGTANDDHVKVSGGRIAVLITR